MPAGDLVRVGRIVKPHGIRGELAVEASGASVGSLPPGAEVWLGRPPRRFLVAGVRPHAGRWLISLEGVTDRNAAEALRNSRVLVHAADLAAPGDDEAFVDELVGCRLESVEGVPLGTVRAVRTGPQDLLEVEGPSETFMVPMVRAWLVELDLAERRIVMRLPDGLGGC